jgi:carboxypeptidase PM20D1
LINQGFLPEQDIYFAFSGGEEVNGNGAPNIVQYLVDHGIQPALVVDEGGAVVENVFPGVKAPCGMIGIAEKGMINAQFRCTSNGGHASAPKPHTPVGILSMACNDVETTPFTAHIEGPAAQMFDTLGRHSTFLYRMIFANMWCFGWIIDLLAKRSGGEMNALLRTTVAFTQMEGSSAPNVIPPEARMVANLRLNPADSVESTLEQLRNIVDNPDVEITALSSQEPSRISQVDCPAWNTVAATVAETWPGCIVTPYLMVQCSDSRHWGRISDKVYRFSGRKFFQISDLFYRKSGIKQSTIHPVDLILENFIRFRRQCHADITAECPPIFFHQTVRKQFHTTDHPDAETNQRNFKPDRTGFSACPVNYQQQQQQCQC